MTRLKPINLPRFPSFSLPNINLFYFFSIIFIKNATLLKKNVTAEEELDCTDIDNIGNLEDSPRLQFMDEECGNLIVVNNSGELIRNITLKSDVLQ